MTDPRQPMSDDRRSATRMLILDTSFRILYPSILVLAIYFVFAGHNRPGGGFVSGLMVGAALSLRYVSGGPESVSRTFRVSDHMILGIGLTISAATALIPMLLGGAVLEHGELELDLAIFGHVKITSTLMFDIGVDLVVIGLVLMAFAAFGDRRVDVPGAGDDGSDESQPKLRIRR